MLPKSLRLPAQITLGRSGKVLKSPYFILKIFGNRLPYARLGAVVSLKVSKKAVVRNKVRRMIYDGVEKNFLAARPGKDFLIISGSRIVELNKQELKSELAKFLV